MLHDQAPEVRIGPSTRLAGLWPGKTDRQRSNHLRKIKNAFLEGNHHDLDRYFYRFIATAIPPLSAAILIDCIACASAETRYLLVGLLFLVATVCLSLPRHSEDRLQTVGDFVRTLTIDNIPLWGGQGAVIHERDVWRALTDIILAADCAVKPDAPITLQTRFEYR